MIVFSLSCLERDRAIGEFTVSEPNDLQFLLDDLDFVINPTVVIWFRAASWQIQVYFNWGFNLPYGAVRILLGLFALGLKITWHLQ